MSERKRGGRVLKSHSKRRGIRLGESEKHIRAALERLAESPRELRCFVIVEEPLTGRFVQFCTPLPPSRFAGSPQLVGDEPLIFDGTGAVGRDAYEPVQELCDVDGALAFALDTLKEYLPGEAELHITEESTRMERPN